MNPKKNPAARGRAFLPACGLWLLFLSAQGCAIGPRIVTEYDSNTFAHNPLHRRVVWTYAWGLVQPRDLNPGCEAQFNHLNKVEVKTNIGFILLSAVTMGAVVPMDLRWDCAPVPANPGDLGEDLSPSTPQP